MIDTNALNLFPINNAANAVVEAAHPGNVDSVFVAGRAVKRGGALLGVDLGELRARVESARDKLLVRSGVADSERWAPAPYSRSLNLAPEKTCELSPVPLAHR